MSISNEVLKYLSDGSPIILVGDGPPRELADGSTVAQVEICRLATELVEVTQVHDQKPEPEAAPGTSPAPTKAAAPSNAQNLDALHAAGVLSDSEYAAAQARL